MVVTGWVRKLSVPLERVVTGDEGVDSSFAVPPRGGQQVDSVPLEQRDQKPAGEPRGPPRQLDQKTG
jgi:hypothetical protein